MRFKQAMFWLRSNDHFRRMLEYSLLHGIAVGLTWYVIYPIQDRLVSEWFREAVFPVPVLFFLPAIIKALAAWMYGWWAILYILPTALLQHVLLDIAWDASGLMMMALYVSVAPIFGSLLRLADPKTPATRHLQTWRSLFAMVIMSSIAIASAYVLVYRIDAQFDAALLFVLLIVFGDALAAAVLLFMLIVFFRARERRAQPIARHHQF